MKRRKKIAEKKKKVLLALSGGVDSAAAAVLLKEQGHEVVCVFLKMGNWGTKGFESAKKIAEKLKLPLRILDIRKEFGKKVTQYFIESYGRGMTPNPCVACNKEIKFKFLFEILKKEKADFVATGHYARKAKSQKTKGKIGEEYFYRLLEAEDKFKDQSYFLHRLTQKDLAKIIFPLGKYKKSEARKIANKLKLPASEKESQDICFAPQGASAFLRKNIRLRRGNIVDESGNILGKHPGFPLYTFGQRKGVDIAPFSPKIRKESRPGPHYVIGKNVKKNELVVTNNPERLLTNVFQIGRINWICPDKMSFPLNAKIQIRYHAEKISAIIKSGKPGGLVAETKKPLRAVTPGQSAVFYGNGEVLGGGVIIK